MTTAGSATPARIAAGLLAAVVLVSGCAQRAFVFKEPDQDRAQFARDQAECTAEAKETTSYSQALGEGFRTTLVSSVIGAVVGAITGGLVSLAAVANAPPDDQAKAGLIIGGSAGAGAVIGWFVGTGIGVVASARHAQDLVDVAFQRCMDERGYKTGRDR